MRWLVFLPAAILALYSTTVEAQEQPTGVLVTVYDNWTQWNQYNNAPPLPPTTRIAGMVTQQQVLNNFDAQPLFGLRDDFVVRYEGHLSAPSTGAVQFMAQADDGTRLFINDELVTNDWYDKGGGGSISAPVNFTEGVSQPFTLWFYENGGGAWVQLWWLIEGQWAVVPESAFTQVPVSTTSTTSTTTTSTTTTEVPTTTTALPEPSTTAEPIPTTTQELFPPTTLVETSTTYQPSESTAMPSSTTPTAIIDNTVISSTSLTLPATTTSTVVVRPTVTPNLTTTTQETPTTIAPVASTTTIQVQVPQEGDNAAEAVLTALVGGVSNDEAKTIVLDEKALEVLDKTEAEAVFAALDVDALNETELAVLVATVQQASDEVREAFEEQVNVFSGAVDSYVPLGSTVPVSTRRVVIAVSAALSAVPTPTRKS